MLILPPTNHSACGGSHFKTVSHFRNQCNSISAKRAQNFSGSALASASNASSSVIDLIYACSANDLGGGKTRASCCSDSMLVVTDDIVFQEAVIVPAFRLTVIISRFSALRQSRAGRPGLLRLHWEQRKSRPRRRARRRHNVRRAKRCCAGADAAPRDSTRPRSLCAGARGSAPPSKSLPETGNTE